MRISDTRRLSEKARSEWKRGRRHVHPWWWTPEQLKTLRESMDRPASEVARLIGRSEVAIYRKRERLRECR